MGDSLSKDRDEKVQIGDEGELNKEESKNDNIDINNLSLNGNPLPLPRMHHVNWKDGQIFSEKEDPDRMKCEWGSPKFLFEKDPRDQKGEVLVEEIDLESIGVDPNPHKNWPYNSFAKVIHNLLTPEECFELINSVNEKGKLKPTLYGIRFTSQILPIKRLSIIN